MSNLKCLIAGCALTAGMYFLTPYSAHQADTPPVAPPAAASPTLHAGVLPDFTRLVERVGPAVVNITTRAVVHEVPDIAERHFDLYRGLMGQEAPPRAVIALGSGFILGDDGYILTNAHVVAGADDVKVRLSGSKRDLKARIVGTDKETDIALLKIQASGLQVARTGNSESLKVGDWVAAIGSPFGFDNTITAGIISAKGRVLAQDSHIPFLQSDVAINPGSSGGPLVNLDGEVVGINSKIYTRSGGYMGVSFAIPIETALKVGNALRERGFIDRGFLGVETQSVSSALASSFELDNPRGALVTSVQPDSAAARAGLRPGDIVLSYAGTRIMEPNELSRAVADSIPGSRVDVEVWRRKTRFVAPVVVDSLPEQRPEAAGREGAHALTALDLVLTEVPLDQRRDLKIDFGLVVNEINGELDPESLLPGDVIVGVNDIGFKTRGEFNRLLASRPVPAALLVLRQGHSRFVALQSTL